MAGISCVVVSDNLRNQGLRCVGRGRHLLSGPAQSVYNVEDDMASIICQAPVICIHSTLETGV